MNNFIGTYQVSEKLCDKIIDFYNQNKQHVTSGKVYNNKVDDMSVVNEVKQSYDLTISSKYSYYPMDEYRTHLQECLELYMKSYDEVNNHSRFKIAEDYNIQYYPVGGGFKKWHFEAFNNVNKSRILVFMTYLNDVSDGGTMFKYQNLTLSAKKGKTVIWPAGFTHTHKGQISETKEKFIVTGWWSLINE